ncbi:MAG: hypothetical protein EOP88_26870 [Verrucomicrobiaceae bacterium]|nr:MAG: hypothetical protein EOP88_26870 [Verrucomicrobiaceae bacterium]
MKPSASLLFVALLGILPASAEYDRNKAEKEYRKVVRTASRYPAEKFYQAVQDGDVKEVKRLLRSGVPVSLRIAQEDGSIIPPWCQVIHEAGDDPIMMRLLLASGADPMARDSTGNTPLHYASGAEVAKLLLERGADVSAVNEDGEQPIHLVIGGSEPEEQKFQLFQLLIKHGANPKARDAAGLQPIHLATRQDSLKIVESLLNQGASPSAVVLTADEYGHKGWQPLHFVGANTSEICPQQAEIVRLLISKGVDVNATTAKGETPLHLLRGAAVTRQLLDRGAAVNVRDNAYGRCTPLHEQAWRSDAESIRLLVDYGAEIDALTEFGETALDKAAFHGRKEVVACLLKKGAKPTRNALAEAERSNETEVAIIIRARLSPSYLRPAHRR